MSITSTDQPVPAEGPTLHVDASETIESYPATIRANYLKVDSQPDAPWLTAILKYLPVLLDTLSEPGRTERLTLLARTLSPHYWRVDATAEMQINGKEFIAEFFRTVPLLNEQEVRERLKNPESIQWSDLMQVTYADHTYYVADQFESDGTVNPIFGHIVKSFKTSPDYSDWDVALWWFNRTGWLSDARPRDIYREDPEGLTQALEQSILDEY